MRHPASGARSRPYDGAPYRARGRAHAAASLAEIRVEDDGAGVGRGRMADRERMSDKRFTEIWRGVVQIILTLIGSGAIIAVVALLPALARAGGTVEFSGAIEYSFVANAALGAIALKQRSAKKKLAARLQEVELQVRPSTTKGGKPKPKPKPKPRRRPKARR